MSAAERLAYVQSQANTAIVCEKCGSSWFTDVSYQQFSGSRYATTPGGDIQVISAMTPRIRVCLCGYPVVPKLGGVRPGRTAAGEVASFQESLKFAKDYIESSNQPAEPFSTDSLIADFTSRDEYHQIQAKLEELETLIKGLTSTAASTEVEKPATQVETPVETKVETKVETPAEPKPEPEAAVTDQAKPATPRVGGKFVKKAVTDDAQ